MADPDNNADFLAALGDSDEDPLHFELSGVAIEFDSGMDSDPSADFRYLDASEFQSGKELAVTLTEQREHPVEMWSLQDETLYPGHCWMFRGRFYWTSSELGDRLAKHEKVLRETYGDRSPARQDEIAEILEKLAFELDPDRQLVAGLVLPLEYLRLLRDEFDLSQERMRERVRQVIGSGLLDEETALELEELAEPARLKRLFEPADANSMETYDDLLAYGELEVPSYLTVLLQRFGLSHEGLIEHLDGLRNADGIKEDDYEFAVKVVREMMRQADEQAVEARRTREHIPIAVQREVWRRDQGRCVQCGSNERLEYDHMIPVSRGGSNTVRNIQLLCESCNRSKGNRI